MDSKYILNSHYSSSSSEASKHRNQPSILYLDKIPKVRHTEVFKSLESQC